MGHRYKDDPLSKTEVRWFLRMMLAYTEVTHAAIEAFIELPGGREETHGIATGLASSGYKIGWAAWGRDDMDGVIQGSKGLLDAQTVYIHLEKVDDDRYSLEFNFEWDSHMEAAMSLWLKMTWETETPA